MKIPNFLAGHKTYILAWTMIWAGVVGFFFPDFSLSADPVTNINMGLIAVGLRRAIS